MNEQEFFPSENQPTPNTPEKKPKNTLLIIACILAAISIFVMLLSPILSLIASYTQRDSYPAVNTAPTVAGEDISEKALLSAMNSTVIVMCGNSAGSGIIIREDGYILTNYHVITDDSPLSVILYSDQKEHSAALIGYSERMDIAVLKIDTTALPTASFASSDTLRYGEKVYAIGAPTGADFGWSVTHGIISCPKRKIEIYDDNGKLEKTMTLIQTDAAVNHGNSGGPLINIRGEVVGIVTLRHSKGTGMGFALPADKALGEAVKIIDRNK